MFSLFLASLLVLDAPAGRNCGPPPNGNRPWVGDSDYPVEARAMRMRGKVEFTLDVGPHGCVTRCTVIKSSGYELLDRKTCELMIVRARFIPEKDKAGRPTGGRVTKTMTWGYSD